jgi:hypothetical protein
MPSLNADGGTGLSGYSDTLAQSFFVDRNLLLTKIDLFFSEKHDKLPVELSVRKLENGIPSSSILPNSIVVVDSDNINTSANAAVATSFTFPVPINLESGQYCFALSSDSKKHRVYVGQIGGEDNATGSTIFKQPYSGVMLMSTNGVNWTVDQTRDVKFKIYRANVTSQVATVDLIVSKNSLKQPTLALLENNPFQAFNGQSILRVYHKNHGFTNGSVVKYDGIPGHFAYEANTSGNTVSISNIPTLLLANTYLTVSNVVANGYTVATAANSFITGNITSGRFGGGGITATTPRKFSAIYPAISTTTPPRTVINHKLKTTDTSFTVSSFESFNPDTIYFNTERLLVDNQNASISMAGAESFVYRLELKTSDGFVSPTIDLPFTSALFITPDINSPSTADNLSTDLVTIANANTLISFNGTGNVTIGGALEKANVKTMVPGAFVTITTSGAVTNNGTFRLTAVSNEGASFSIPVSNAVPSGNVTSIVYRPMYVSDEAASGSSTRSNYVTKKIELATPATSLLVRFAVSKPAGADVEVYYKLQNGSEAISFDTKEYTQLSLPTIKNTVDGQFVDIEKLVDSLASFNAFVIKVVLKSTNIATYPKVKDLRIIALE